MKSEINNLKRITSEKQDMSFKFGMRLVGSAVIIEMFFNNEVMAEEQFELIADNISRGNAIIIGNVK